MRETLKVAFPNQVRTDSAGGGPIGRLACGAIPSLGSGFRVHKVHSQLHG